MAQPFQYAITVAPSTTHSKFYLEYFLEHCKDTKIIVSQKYVCVLFNMDEDLDKTQMLNSSPVVFLQSRT